MLDARFHATVARMPLSLLSVFRCRVCGPILTALWPMSSLAQPLVEPQPLQPVVRYDASAQVLHHENLYRVSDANGPRAGSLLRARFGLTLDREWSLQRLGASAYLQPSWRLGGAGQDAVDWGLLARLDAAMGRAVFGDLTASLTRLQTPWEDVGGALINHQRIASLRGLGGVRLTPDWSMIAALDGWRSDNTLASRQAADLRRWGAEAGVRYWPDRALQLDAVWRRETGRPGEAQRLDASGLPLPVAVFNDWTQHAGLLRARWTPGERSQWFAQAGYLRRQHDQFPERDFSGLTGALQGRWAMSGALDWQVTLSRGIDVPEVLAANFVDVRTIELRPRWQFTSQSALLGWIRVSRRLYAGDPASAIVDALERADRLRELGLRLELGVHRWTVAHVDLIRAQRRSNFPAFDFDDTVVAAGLTARF